MNLKMDLSPKNQSLLTDIGIKIENRNYTSDELKQYENSITDYIFAKSSKNGDLSNELLKYNDVINILISNE